MMISLDHVEDNIDIIIIVLYIPRQGGCIVGNRYIY